jgi:hypothetical protein
LDLNLAAGAGGVRKKKMADSFCRTFQTQTFYSASNSAKLVR